MRERCEGEMGFERREFIRSIRWGVCDSLNCRHSRENISIKVFYNRASLGLTFLASRREGVWSEEVWSQGGGECGRGWRESRGCGERREERNYPDTDSQLEELCGWIAAVFFSVRLKKRSSRETEPVFQRSSTWLVPIREEAACRLKPPLNLCPPPALRVLQRIVRSLCVKCMSSFWAAIFLPLQLFLWNFLLRTVGGAELYLWISSTGAEAGAAEQVQGQPPEAAGGGGEALRRPVQTVHHGQAGPRETGAERWLVDDTENMHTGDGSHCCTNHTRVYHIQLICARFDRFDPFYELQLTEILD